MSDNGSTPAYPQPPIVHGGNGYPDPLRPGLTKREEFAKAIIPVFVEHYIFNMHQDPPYTEKDAAHDACMIADALLKELDKPGGDDLRDPAKMVHGADARNLVEAMELVMQCGGPTLEEVARRHLNKAAAAERELWAKRADAEIDPHLDPAWNDAMKSFASRLRGNA